MLCAAVLDSTIVTNKFEANWLTGKYAGADDSISVMFSVSHLNPNDTFSIYIVESAPRI